MPEFLYHVTRMLQETGNSHLIEWDEGKIFVHDPTRLEAEVLGNYFRHSKYSSFQRQLNYFGFNKQSCKRRMSPCSYTNDRTTKDLSSLLSLKRKSVKKKRADAKDKTSHQALSDALQLAQNAAHARRDQQSQQQQSPSSLPTSVAVCSSNLQSFPKAQTQMLGQQFYWSRDDEFVPPGSIPDLGHAVPVTPISADSSPTSSLNGTGYSSSHSSGSGQCHFAPIEARHPGAPTRSTPSVFSNDPFVITAHQSTDSAADDLNTFLALESAFDGLNDTGTGLDYFNEANNGPLVSDQSWDADLLSGNN